MSECQGVRCDRCGARALLVEQPHVTSLPDGWSVVEVSRAQPFYKAFLDLCLTCTDEALSVLRGKST